MIWYLAQGIEAPVTQAQSSDHFQIIMGALATVIVGLGGVVANQFRVNAKAERISERTERIRNQVENDHDTNLREEADERHSTTTDKLDAAIDKLDIVVTLVETQGVSIGSLQRGQGEMYQLIKGHTADIEDLKSVASTKTREEITAIQNHMKGGKHVRQHSHTG